MTAFYHKWKDNGDLLDCLDNPKPTKAKDLNECEEVYTTKRHITQVHVIGLVLGRHQHDENSLDKLHTTQTTNIN